MQRALEIHGDEPRNSQIDRRIGERIRARRIALGVSQNGLGVVLGVSFQQVQRYENGMNRIVASQLAAICSFLNLEPNRLFEDLVEPRRRHIVLDDENFA